MGLSDSSTGSRSLAALDLLRFGCALLVVAHHLGTSFVLAPGELSRVALHGIVLPTGATPYSWFGWIGVELFFVLSGYVIALSARGARPAGFAGRRVLRLAPAAWVCASTTALVLFAAGVTYGAPLHTRWAASMLFNPTMPQIDASYWTLGIEVSFYLLVALMLRRGSSPARFEKLAAGLVLWSGLYWLLRISVDAYGGLPPGIFANLSLASYGAFFALGIILQAEASGEGTGGGRMIAALALVIGAIEIIDHALDRITTLKLAASPLAPLAVFGAGLAVIIFAPRLRVGPRAGRIGTTLGLATYPLYLIHQEIGAVLVARLSHLGVPYGLTATLVVLAAVAAALACTRFAEPPIRRLLARVPDASVRVLAAVRLFSRRHAPGPDSPPTASPPAG